VNGFYKFQLSATPYTNAQIQALTPKTVYKCSNSSSDPKSSVLVFHTYSSCSVLGFLPRRAAGLRLCPTPSLCSGHFVCGAKFWFWLFTHNVLGSLCVLCSEKDFGFRSSHTMFLVFSVSSVLSVVQSFSFSFGFGFGFGFLPRRAAGLRLCSTPSLRSGHLVCVLPLRYARGTSSVVQSFSFSFGFGFGFGFLPRRAAGLRLCSTPSLRSRHFVCGAKFWFWLFTHNVLGSLCVLCSEKDFGFRSSHTMFLVPFVYSVVKKILGLGLHTQCFWFSLCPLCSLWCKVFVLVLVLVSVLVSSREGPRDFVCALPLRCARGTSSVVRKILISLFSIQMLKFKL